jgi:hypothetical protein
MLWEARVAVIDIRSFTETIIESSTITGAHRNPVCFYFAHGHGTEEAPPSSESDPDPTDSQPGSSRLRSS